MHDDITELEKQDIVQKAAVILRDEIPNIKPNKLSDQLTTNDLIESECTVPNTVNDFFYHV